jgi:PEP-CTERM motif
MKSRGGLSAVVLATLVAGAGPASATDAVYEFYYGDGAQPVARLTTTGNTAFSFAFLSAPSTGAFINDILLDMGSGVFTNTTINGSTTPTYSYSAGGYEGTGMQTKISFPMANGSGRLIVGETAMWKIEGAFDGPARLHVNAFIDGKSVKLTTPVPEPESYAMALAALGVLGVSRRLSRSKT